MEAFLSQQGLLIKEFGRFVSKQADRLKEHAKGMAKKQGRTYMHLNRYFRKEELAHEIAEKDGIREGLVCVFSTIEACQSFRIAFGKGRPRIERADRKCLCIYYYFIDRELGFIHVRIQTWFPLTVQICLNGHDWLARKLDRHLVPYTKIENAFTWISNYQRAQRFADRFTKRNWPRILSAITRRLNPLMPDLFKNLDYYWVVDQAEYATDVFFQSPQALIDLYPKLLEHAVECFSAEDVMTFLGKKLNGNFKGEVRSEFKKRWPGARIRHQVKGNWIKMYNKNGSVLRVETVINRPYCFKVRRSGRRGGKQIRGWFPMKKGVSNFFRYAEVSRAANSRYFDALAIVEDPSEARRQMRTLSSSVRENDRPFRGFNPAAEDDVALFKAVLRGEHAVSGFRNRDIRGQLFSKGKDRKEMYSQSARVSRLLKRLHVRGFIAKIPRSRCWKVTQKGQIAMSAVLKFQAMLGDKEAA
jgi:hypothetical protein